MSRASAKTPAPSTSSPRRVFVSYTAEDLVAYADAVVEVVRGMGWIVDDHRDWSSSGRPSVEECVKRVRECDVLVVLVAHRYGWIPAKKQGGDGERSITWIEVDAAMRAERPVLAFLVDDDQPWPPSRIERLGNPRIGDRLDKFKTLLRNGVVNCFTDERSLTLLATKSL